MDFTGGVGERCFLSDDQGINERCARIHLGGRVLSLRFAYLLDIGGLHSVGAPIHIYPLYENGFRAHRGQSIKNNHEESSALYANFSKVATSNPYSWNYGNEVETSQSIGTVSKKNRMICFPCKSFGVKCVGNSLTVRSRSTSNECFQYCQLGSGFNIDLD